MGDRCRSLLVNNFLLSSLLLRRLIYLLIYLLSSHLFRWLLYSHATKIHVLVIQHLEFHIEWRNFSRCLVVAKVLLLLSHLSGWLRAAIYLCLNRLDRKLAFKGILQFDPFAHSTRWNSRFALLFIRLIIHFFGWLIEVNFVNFTLLLLLFYFDTHFWGWIRISCILSLHSLSKNRRFWLFEILFLINLR